MRNLNGWISFLSLILLAFMVSGCSSDSDEEQNMSIVMPDSNQKNQSFNSDDVSGSFSFVATISICSFPTFLITRGLIC